MALLVVSPKNWRRISSAMASSSSSSSLDNPPSSLSSRTCLILPSQDSLDCEIVAQTLLDLKALPHVSSFEEAIQYNHDELTHSLTLEPYSYSSGSGLVNTFAIALQSLSVPDNTTGRRGRKKSVRARSRAPPRMKPLFIDFMDVIAKRHSVSKGGGGGELIIKAMGSGFKSSKETTITTTTPSVWDMTTGFGQDSITIAMAGAAPHVTMMERDDIVSTLVSDALRRLSLVAELEGDARDVRLARDLSNRMTLMHGDGISLGTHILNHKDNGSGNVSVGVDRYSSISIMPDICYLDPMFPPRTKSSAVKKKMQLLHGLFDDIDESTRLEEERTLLDVALSVAQSRVVVKRPIHAPPLGGLTPKGEERGVRLELLGKEVQQPSFQVKGSINRFDVYLTQG